MSKAVSSLGVGNMLEASHPNSLARVSSRGSDDWREPGEAALGSVQFRMCVICSLLFPPCSYGLTSANTAAKGQGVKVLGSSLGLFEEMVEL